MPAKNQDAKQGLQTPGIERTKEKAAAPSSPELASYKPKYKPLWNNFITMAGVFLATIGLLGLLTFGLFSIVMPATNPYVDIVGYLVMPGILVLGLLIIPFGMLIKGWRLHRRYPDERIALRFPRIDLNDPLQRRAAKIFVFGTFILLPIVGVSSYHGYHYTDSVTFCSKPCHAVMEPEATTFTFSDHARVACAECHIGEGASWFVKSKLSGTRQVLAMWRDSYSRPIPPAIKHLRPARETCEHCHWPEKFFGAQLREIARFASDEKNTREDISMLLNTGGRHTTAEMAEDPEGSHWHVTMKGRIEYIATDDNRQEIPWVKWIDARGDEKIYRSDGRPSSDPKPQGQLRVLDCMDCHNRPAHRFRSPAQAVDEYLEFSRIDTTLPFIKRQAVAALAQPYPDVKTAEAHIGAALTEFYRDNYPDIWQKRRAPVQQAINRTREIYRRNFFPTMKVDWKTYPDHIGHKIYNGCFRCHEGSHVNQYGEVISHRCDTCHTFLNPTRGEGGVPLIERGEFVHPLPLEGLHGEMRCSKCHDGGPARPTTCSGCHDRTTALRTAEGPSFERFGIQPEPMADMDCQDCHADLSEPVSLAAMNDTCVECHDPQDDERFETLLADWDKSARRELAAAAAAVDKLRSLADADDEADQAPRRKWLDRNAAVLDWLRQAGPLHNYEASIKISKQLTAEAKRLTATNGLAEQNK
ncbi:MAG TPA: cytochrome c3 family protein [Phycisphaerae bacterium]|nr:cytochrome c3 family protein [Phycisphaerae bacterium]